MGLIQLEGMEFYAYHGHYAEERVVGNRFLIDLEIKCKTSKAAESDDISDAVNYQTIYSLIKSEMEIKSHLLENIAKRIIKRIYKEMPEGIEDIKIKVSKMHPPLGGQVEKVSIIISG